MARQATRTYTYRGQTIYPCEAQTGEHRGRWAVQNYHQTGIPWADQECPHYQTLDDARDSIDIWLYQTATTT